jgi:hypothetical protein
LHIANLHYQAIGKSGRHADLRLLNADQSDIVDVRKYVVKIVIGEARAWRID